MGAMKMAYALMKFRNAFPEATIIQGHSAQPPTKATRTEPRRTLMYFGASVVTSLAKETAFALMLTLSWPSSQIEAQKKAAARPPEVSIQVSMICSGVQ